MNLREEKDDDQTFMQSLCNTINAAPTSAPARSRGTGDNYPSDEDHEEKDQKNVRVLLHPHHRLFQV